MTKTEIKQRETKEAKFFREMGYTFSSLVQHYLQEQRFQSLLKERLVFIEKMGGRTCICSSFSVEKNGTDGTNTVPSLWCMTKDNHDKPCPYVKASKEEMAKAISMREELEKYNKGED